MCSLQGNGLCDRRSRPCKKVTVLGSGFIPSENMTCHVEEVRVRTKNYQRRQLKGTKCSALSSKFSTGVVGAL